MDKKIGVLAIVALVIGAGYILYSTFFTVPVTTTSNLVSNTTPEVNTASSESKAKIAESESIPKMATESQLIAQVVTKVSGVSFVPPSGWLEVDASESFPRHEGSRGISFRSDDYRKKEVVEVAMNNEADILKGGVVSVGFEKENVASTLENATAYAAFQHELMKDCSNCSEAKTISISGVPASFHVSYADGGGGFITAETFLKGEIFNVSLHFGRTESYESYKEVFSAVLDSIKFN